jgi:hypothetical protein
MRAQLTFERGARGNHSPASLDLVVEPFLAARPLTFERGARGNHSPASVDLAGECLT